VTPSQQHAEEFRTALAQALDAANAGDFTTAQRLLMSAQGHNSKVTYGSPEKAGLYDAYVEVRDYVTGLASAAAQVLAAQNLAATQAANARRAEAKAVGKAREAAVAEARRAAALAHKAAAAVTTVVVPPQAAPPVEPFYQEVAVAPEGKKSGNTKWVIGGVLAAAAIFAATR
jgi:hypothetical protein